MVPQLLKSLVKFHLQKLSVTRVAACTELLINSHHKWCWGNPKEVTASHQRKLGNVASVYGYFVIRRRMLFSKSHICLLQITYCKHM